MLLSVRMQSTMVSNIAVAFFHFRASFLCLYRDNNYRIRLYKGHIAIVMSNYHALVGNSYSN